MFDERSIETKNIERVKTITTLYVVSYSMWTGKGQFCPKKQHQKKGQSRIQQTDERNWKNRDGRENKWDKEIDRDE